MFRPGDTIDAWTVERQLGAGGMGSVYLCRNRGARRILAAVKVLDARLDASPKVRARFVREAELLFSLQHPHIVQVRNVRMDATPPYLEMEFVEGPSLDAVLDGGALAPGDAAAIAAQVADALAYVHARGIFHRDVKPSNIVMQPDGTAKLVDFGIAAEAGSTTVSEAGQAIGSALYVPPEWLSGTVDPVQWDLYALGVVLHELLTGERAFSLPTSGGATQQFIATLVAKQALPPLDPTAAPDALRDLVRDLTSPDPAVRPKESATVLARLRALGNLARDPDFATRCARHEAPASDALPGPGGANTWSGTDTSAGVFEVQPSTIRGTYVPEPADAGPVPSGGSGRPDTHESAQELPTEAPPRRGARVASLALAGLAIAGAAAWVAWPTPGPSPRPVRLAVTGAPDAGADAALHVRWDDSPVALVPGPDGATTEFAEVAPGAHRVEVRQGEGCAADPAPAWCGVERHTVTVPAGEGVHPVTLTAATVPEREVVVTEATGALFTLRIGDTPEGAEPPAPRGAARVTLRPGSHRATASGGAACPPDCAQWAGTIEVPWGEGPWSTTLTLTAATPAATRETPPSRPATMPVGAAAESPAKPTPREGGSGRSVRVRELAAWLEGHNEWHPETARAAGRADADYLKGWTGATPPAVTDAPALATNPGLATAYCAGKGGVARVDAPPTAWTDMATAGWHEWRGDGGSIVSLQSSGSASPPVSAAKTGKYTGFRCALP